MYSAPIAVHAALQPLTFSAPSSGHRISVTQEPSKPMNIKIPERGEKIRAEALKYFLMQLIREMTLG